MTSENPVVRANFEFAPSDRRVVAADDGVLPLLGYEAGDFLAGRVDLMALIHGDDGDVADALFATAEGVASAGFNLRIRHADGRIRCCRAGAEARRVGAELRLRVVVEDAKSLACTIVTPATMTNFRAMMENTDDFIFFKNRHHVFTGASQTLVAITDPTEHWTDLIGKTDYDVFAEAYADVYYRLEKDVFAGRAVAHEVQEIRAKDGTRGWVDNRKYPIRDDAGRIIGLFGIARDISAMKRIEEAQQEALATLRKIAARVPGVVFQFRLRADGSTCFPYASDALHELYGLRPEDVRDDAATLIGALHPDDGELIRRSVARSARDLTPWQEDFRVRLGDGRLRWLSGNALPEREDDGGVLWYGFITDVTERKALEEQVRQMAFVDVLTELPNRRLLSDRLAQAMAASARNACYGAVIFLDLDNFKPLNDTYGHAVGDMLLVVAAERLKGCVRSMDTVARFGGDEFVIMVRDLGVDRDEAAAQAAQIAEKIRGALFAPYVLTLKVDGLADSEVTYRCTASVGVAMFKGDRTSEDDVLRLADKAMYRAKESGRNAVEFAAESQREAALAQHVAHGFVQLTWHDDYDCGNALIDGQHRALFGGANRLIAAALAGRAHAEIGALIDDLAADLLRHFDDEEAILAAAGFAGLADHESLHRELGASVRALAEQFRSGALSSGELMRFLAEDVVARHMLTADRAYFGPLARASADASEVADRR